MNKNLCILAVLFFLILSVKLMAWDDLTHIAIGQAAGFKEAWSLPAADIAKIKAFSVEDYNHYCNNPKDADITPEMINKQIPRYNNGKKSEKKGHLYGAIVASVREYIKKEKLHINGLYDMAYAGHYIGDLSMPFHNMEYDSFNRKRHEANDGIVEKEIGSNMAGIKLYTIKIDSEDSLIRNIADIADKAKELGYRLEKENRDMTKTEAYEQISQSASLFKAVLEYAGYFDRNK